MSDHDIDASVLETTDRQAISDTLQGLLHEQANRFDNIHPDTVSLFRDSQALFDQPGGPEEFERRYLDLDDGGRYLFSRLSLIEAHVDQAARRIARLNIPDDPQNNPYHLETMVKLVAAAGKDPNYIEDFLSGLWIGDTGTPHPTGNLNEGGNDTTVSKSGVDLFLDLLDIGTAKNRQEAAVHALREMIDIENLAPDQRSTTLQELMFGAEYAVRHLNARTQVLDNISEAVAKVFGQKRVAKEPPNFSRRGFFMVMSLLLWHAADSDGKPNAEQWTVLAAEVLTSYLSISMHLWRVQEANKKLQEGQVGQKPRLSLQAIWGAANDQSPEVEEDLREIHDFLSSLKTDLWTIFEDVQNHYQQIHDPALEAEERGAKFEELDPKFEELRRRMGEIYDNRQFYGRPFKNDRGLDLYQRLWQEFKDLRNRGLDKNWDPVAVSLLEDSAEDLRSDGIAFFKSEPRHNDDFNRRIVDNLFSHKEFRRFTLDESVLSQDDLNLIDSENGFSDLRLGDQNRILSKVQNRCVRWPGYLRRFLLAANPAGYDENGYPVQTHSLLRRLDVMAPFQLQFGPKVIIAEADGSAKRRQTFILSAFDDLSLMVPTPLTEDLENMTETHRQLERSHRHGAYETLIARQKTRVPKQFIRAAYTWMFARSDITRQFGVLSGVLVYMQAQLNTTTAACLGIPAFVKEGSGLSNERGGGDPMAMTRLIAQALQEWLGQVQVLTQDAMSSATAHIIAQGIRDNKTPGQIAQIWEQEVGDQVPKEIRAFGRRVLKTRLKLGNLQPDHNEIKQVWCDSVHGISGSLKTMASTVLVTRQGRELYTTEEEIAREMRDKISEMLGMRMELDGLVKKGTFIPQRDEFSPTMEEFLHTTIHKMMNRYSDIRDANSANSGDNILDALAFIASDWKIAGSTNNAARKQSKSKGTGPKTLRQQRAIGNNIWIALMQTHHDGYFTAGEFMREMHRALHAGEISRQDVAQFMESDHWNYNFFVRSLTPLARADFSHSFKRLARETGQPIDTNHDRLLNIEAHTKVEDGVLKLDLPEDVDEKEAYLAMLYADGFSMVAGTLAVLDGSFAEQNDFGRILQDNKPSGDSLRFEFGEVAARKWPFLRDTQEAAKCSRPALTVMHILEEQLRNGEKIDERTLRQAASAWRATTVEPNGHVYDYTYSSGRRRQPLPADFQGILEQAV